MAGEPHSVTSQAPRALADDAAGTSADVMGTNPLAVASTALSSLGFVSLIRLFRGVDRPAKSMMLLVTAVGASIAGVATGLKALRQIRAEGDHWRGRGWAIAGVSVGTLDAGLIATGMRLFRARAR